ncbi:Ankyrin repeat domain-containing protein [Balamuthia mandrillaris]
MEENLKALIASVDALREDVRPLAALQQQVHSLSENNQRLTALVASLREELRSLSTTSDTNSHKRHFEEDTYVGTSPAASRCAPQPRTKKTKLSFPPPSSDHNHPANDDEQVEATPTYRWDDLPEELLCALFDVVEPAYVGMAARTCRSWWACAGNLRRRLAKVAVCSSMALLQWAVENGCPLDRELCAAIAKEGQLELLRWARWNGCPWDRRTIHNASGGGHLGVVRWARKNGCQWDEHACAAAAAHGHLEVLKWLHAHGCPWTEDTTDAAAEQGHFGVLKWAYEHGCAINWEWIFHYAARRANKAMLEWAKKTSKIRPSEVCMDLSYAGDVELLCWARAKGFPFEPVFDQSPCGAAAAEGHLDVLKWLRENDCPWYDTHAVAQAAVSGGLQVLQWLQEAQGELFDSNSLSGVCTVAATQGKLKIVQWAFENGGSLSHQVIDKAATGGHLELIKWARENGCLWTPSAAANAAQMGHLETLKWLHENGCPWNEKTCIKAARNGHLEILKWARSQGCPWNANTTWNAAFKGHLEVLAWAVGNGCPLDAQHACDWAARAGQVAIVRWLLDTPGFTWLPNWVYNEDAEDIADGRGMRQEDALELLKLSRQVGHPWTTDMFSFAALGGHLETIRWLWKEGCPFDEDVCAMAAGSGELEALQWLHAHGCPWDEGVYKEALLKGKLAVVQWLVNAGCPMVPLVLLQPEGIAVRKYLRRLASTKSAPPECYMFRE